MAKFKKNDDYYVKSDISVKVDGKKVLFVLDAGSKLKLIKEDKEYTSFKVQGSTFSLSIINSEVESYVSNFGEEIERSAK